MTSDLHLARVRVALGLLLAVRFAQLVPFGRELFSSAGMLPDARVSPLARAFPNLLVVADGPPTVTALLLAGALAGVLLAAGSCVRPSALAAWYVGACLAGRNPLISNPSLPFVGWMLLLYALRKPGDDDRTFRAAGWIVLAAGYTYSGICKLQSPSWVDGTALAHVLANPLARPTALRELLLALPPVLLMLGTWGALALEALFAPLALSRRVRPWLWLTMTAMHLGLLVLVDFAELTAGMLLIHAFTFDPAWLGARQEVPRPVRLTPSACGT